MEASVSASDISSELCGRALNPKPSLRASGVWLGVKGLGVKVADLGAQDLTTSAFLWLAWGFRIRLELLHGMQTRGAKERIRTNNTTSVHTATCMHVLY